MFRLCWIICPERCLCTMLHVKRHRMYMWHAGRRFWACVINDIFPSKISNDNMIQLGDMTSPTQKIWFWQNEYLLKNRSGREKLDQVINVSHQSLFTNVVECTCPSWINITRKMLNYNFIDISRKINLYTKGRNGYHDYTICEKRSIWGQVVQIVKTNTRNLW